MPFHFSWEKCKCEVFPLEFVIELKQCSLLNIHETSSHWQKNYFPYNIHELQTHTCFLTMDYFFNFVSFKRMANLVDFS
jgi:hypothetical protein